MMLLMSALRAAAGGLQKMPKCLAVLLKRILLEGILLQYKLVFLAVKECMHFELHLTLKKSLWIDQPALPND